MFVCVYVCINVFCVRGIFAETPPLPTRFALLYLVAYVQQQLRHVGVLVSMCVFATHTFLEKHRHTYTYTHSTTFNRQYVRTNIFHIALNQNDGLCEMVFWLYCIAGGSQTAFVCGWLVVVMLAEYVP